MSYASVFGSYPRSPRRLRQALVGTRRKRAKGRPSATWVLPNRVRSASLRLWCRIWVGSCRKHALAQPLQVPQTPSAPKASAEYTGGPSGSVTVMCADSAEREAQSSPQGRTNVSCPNRQFWAWLDVAARCNLACKLCYTTGMRSRQLMSFRVFTTVLDRFLTSPVELRRLHLNWRGEPVLNPELANMLASLWQRAPGWSVEWHTNGTRVSPRVAHDVVNAHPRQRIYVSLDGGNKESFERNRGRGQWSAAIDGLEELLRARGEREGPQIGIYQLDLGVPRCEYDPRFVALTRHVDLYVVIPPVALDGGSVQQSGCPSLGEIPAGPCFWLGHTLAVDCDGAAFTCLLETGTKLGSLVEEELEVLLDRASHLRRVAECRGRTAIPRCATCRKREGSPQAV